MSSSGPSETAVQFGAVVVAFLVLGAMYSAADSLQLSNATAAAGSVIFNAIVFGGAHLYLAVRGEGGSVPVSSRWRFLAALGAVVAAALLAIAFRDPIEAATGFGAQAIGLAFFAVVALAYVVAEARAGYRDSMVEN